MMLAPSSKEESVRFRTEFVSSPPEKIGFLTSAFFNLNQRKTFEFEMQVSDETYAPSEKQIVRKTKNI